MEAGAVPYITFLVVGVALVFVDGRLIRSSGATYLRAAYPDPEVADSVNRLITVLFHLAVLGVLALISVIDMNGGSALETVVARTGVMLLVLALAHAITIGTLGRLRARQQAQRLRDEMSSRVDERLD